MPTVPGPWAERLPNATGDYTGADPFVCATAEIPHRLTEEGYEKGYDEGYEEGQASAPVDGMPLPLARAR